MKVLRSAVVGMALLSGMLSMGQMSPQQRQPPGGQPGVPPGVMNPGLPSIDGRKPGDVDPLSPELMDRQARSRNTDRQKRLVADTDKLLALATDLKQQVDKTNKDVMSVDVIKKAEEIEKLAKSVKERMKG